MTLHYFLPNEINDRYIGSIIFYKNSPIYVHTYTTNHKPGLWLKCLKIGEGQEGEEEALKRDFVFFNVEDVNLTDGPFCLGYINGVESLYKDTLYKGVSFCKRVPVRKFKQGLTSQNIIFSPMKLSFNKALTHKGFKNMLEGEYPSFKDVPKFLKVKTNLSIAFNRHWAFHRKIDKEEFVVCYRGLTVGDLPDMSDLTNIKLRKEFSYLEESFQVGVENARNR